MVKRSRKLKKANQPQEPVLISFMEHIRELRGRLFWTAIWFVVVSAIIFPFYHTVIDLLMKPLGGEKLYYLSPVGGLGFAMKICVYVGLIATLPVIIYHLYRFIAPVMPTHRSRTAIGYVILSSLLAFAGIVFAYLVTLPSAMHFLTHFNLGNISAMLTVDAYLSFVVVYLVTSAALFQLPLIMVIVDTITPTPPSVWHRFQRHMIVAAFVIAMLITPVPDILNQVMLALPIILMYQFGIGLVWLRHRTRRARRVVDTTPLPALDQRVPIAAAVPAMAAPAKLVQPHTVQAPVVSVGIHRAPSPALRSIDGLTRPTRPGAPMSVPRRPMSTAPSARPQHHTARQPVRLGISVDGFLPAR